MSRAVSSMQPPLGIMGGAFDPVHYGHLRAAVELGEELALSELRFIPSGTPPHRQAHFASGAVRARMLKAAVSGLSACSVDERELQRAEPSWSVLTLEEYRNEMPGRSLCLIMGMDAFLGLPDWYRWEELLQLAHLVVACRPGSELPATGVLGELLAACRTDDIQKLHAESAGQIYVKEVTQLEISSSDIRQRLSSGRSIEFLVPPTVTEIIAETHCYAQAHGNNKREQSPDAK